MCYNNNVSKREQKKGNDKMYNKKFELVIKEENHFNIMCMSYFEDFDKMHNFVDKNILSFYPNAKIATLAYMGKNSGNGCQNWVLLPYEYRSDFGGMQWLLEKRKEDKNGSV